jgi:hypothetical protein
VAGADDPFDPDAGALLKNGREFLGKGGGEVGEEVQEDRFKRNSVPSTSFATSTTIHLP